MNMDGLFLCLQARNLYFCVPSCKGTERCLSGRKGRFAKPLYELKLVPRVRIPPSPPSPTQAMAKVGMS